MKLESRGEMWGGGIEGKEGSVTSEVMGEYPAVLPLFCGSSRHCTASSGLIQRYNEIELEVHNALLTLIRDTTVLREYAAAALLIMQVWE